MLDAFAVHRCSLWVFNLTRTAPATTAQMYGVLYLLCLFRFQSGPSDVLAAMDHMVHGDMESYIEQNLELKPPYPVNVVEYSILPFLDEMQGWSSTGSRGTPASQQHRMQLSCWLRGLFS